MNKLVGQVLAYSVLGSTPGSRIIDTTWSDVGSTLAVVGVFCLKVILSGTALLCCVVLCRLVKELAAALLNLVDPGRKAEAGAIGWFAMAIIAATTIASWSAAAIATYLVIVEKIWRTRS